MVRVDQPSYSILGTLQEAAKNGTTIAAYRDSNHNGVYDRGLDALAGTTTVAKKGIAFAVSVNLQQDAANQFFIIASDGKLSSAPVTVPLISEDSTPPAVVSITRVGSTLTNAGSVQFQVTFSEPVTGVDATDFQVVRSGSVSSGTVSVSGSGSSYTVTVAGLTGAGTLGLNLIDDDTIHDILTNSAQDHPLGGVRAGNGTFTTSETYTLDRVPPTVSSITRTGSVTAAGGTITYTVTFSEPVTGVAATDFSLSSDGLTGASIASLSGSGATYTVSVNTGSGTGALRLDLTDIDSITDAAGNLLGGSGAGNGSFSTGQSYFVLPANADSAWPRSMCRPLTSTCWAFRCRPARSSSVCRPMPATASSWATF